MSVSMRLTGLDRAFGAIVRVDAVGQQAVREAVVETTRAVQRAARAGAPRDTGRLSRSIRSRYTKDRLGAVVTPNRFYGRFLEVGTKKLAPRPFMQPAAEAELPKFVDRLRAAFARAFARGR